MNTLVKILQILAKIVVIYLVVSLLFAALFFGMIESLEKGLLENLFGSPSLYDPVAIISYALITIVIVLIYERIKKIKLSKGSVEAELDTKSEKMESEINDLRKDIETLIAHIEVDKTNENDQLKQQINILKKRINVLESGVSSDDS